MRKPRFEKPLTQSELKDVLRLYAAAIAAEEAGYSDASVRMVEASRALRNLGDRVMFRAMQVRTEQREERPKDQAFAAVAREVSEVRTQHSVSLSMYASTWDRLRAAFGHKTGTEHDR